MTPVGTWRGTSVCLVRPSACNDEIVVYRIAHSKAADSLTMDALKIVRGKKQQMGVLTCRFTLAKGALTCATPQAPGSFAYAMTASLVNYYSLTRRSFATF